MKLIENALIIFLFSVIALPLVAQHQKVGIIKDGITQEVLSSAKVQMDRILLLSDDNGSFQIPHDVKSIEISYIGYDVKKIDFDATASPDTSIFYLEPITSILQTATITSGKYAKPLGEVTVSLEVIKPELIASNALNSTEKVLDKIPGLSMIDGQANIRGGSGFSYGAGSRVLLLIDDIPALQADAGTVNWDDIPIENVEQIEILKGASSALYGSSALNGIINVRTAHTTSSPETKIATFGTVFNAPKDLNKKWWDNNSAPYEMGVTFQHKQKINRLNLVLGANLYKQNSFNKAVSKAYGRATASLKYKLNERSYVGVNTIFNTGNSDNFFYWKNDSLAYEGDPATLNSSKRTRFTIDPFYHYYAKNGDSHKILGRYYYVNNQSKNSYSNFSQLTYIEYQYHKSIKELDLELSAGAVGINTYVDAPLYGDTTYKSSNYAAYFQLDKKFFKKLTLSLGARYEYNLLKSPEIIVDTLLPALNQVQYDTIPNGRTVEAKPVFRFGMNYQLSSFTFLRASFGQGYRFPTIAEKFITTTLGPTRILSNPKLNSETGMTAEVGIKQGLKIGNWNGFVDIAGFWSEYHDMMEFTFIFPYGFRSINVGDTRIKGIDFNVAGQGKIGNTVFNVLTGYTYIDPKFKNFTSEDSLFSSAHKNLLKYRFQHSFKFDVECIYHNVNLGVSGFYYSYMENIDAIFEVFVNGLANYRSKNNNGNFVFDARVGYKINKHFKTTFAVRNLLNEEYSIRPALLEAPRNYTLRLDYSF